MCYSLYDLRKDLGEVILLFLGAVSAVMLGQLCYR